MDDRGNIIEVAFQDDNIFKTVGAKHFKLWTINSGNFNGKETASEALPSKELPL